MRWTAQLSHPKGEPKITDSGDVYSRLKDLVSRQAFRPGHQLIARDLADRLRVSATPVREALIRLAVEKLIVSVAHKGFYTKPLEVAELTNKYELAFIMKRYAIEKNIEHFSMQGIRQPLEIVLTEEVFTANVNQQVSYSFAIFMERVFERIAELSANNEALALVQAFNHHTHYVRLLDLEEPTTVRNIAADLTRLIGHLQVQEKAAAVTQLQKLIFSKIERLPALVKEANARALTANM